MAAYGITQTALAEVLKRDQSYVSERINAKRAFTTDDIDAIAEMIGTDGRTLLRQIARLLDADRPMSDPFGIKDLQLAVAASKRSQVSKERRLLSGDD